MGRVTVMRTGLPTPTTSWSIIKTGKARGYWHLQQSSGYVQPYQMVVTDQLLALSGNSGYVCPEGSGYHLHFFVQNTPPDGTVYNPSIWFSFDDLGHPGFGNATSGNYGQ